MSLVPYIVNVNPFVYVFLSLTFVTFRFQVLCSVFFVEFYIDGKFLLFVGTVLQLRWFG